MKKIINRPEDVVAQMLQGMVGAFPKRLELLSETSVIVRKEKKDNKVVLVSGGGSGHEPAHAGFVGEGMLDAAVAGNIFASPSPYQILSAIESVNADKGVLLIVKNYSGDVMNFEMASELAEIKGINVESVIVNDDISIPEDETNAGRRGIAGTILVHKIAGAKAEQGAVLGEVKRVAEKAIANVRSIGMALYPCTLPEVGYARFNLEDDEMEIGIGIHGEPGIKKTKMKTSDEISKELSDYIFSNMELNRGDRVALLINGLGATPYIELCIFANSVINYFTDKRIEISKVLVGNYMTSLDMAGVSLSVLRLDDELEELLLEPIDVPAFNSF